jgi:hypothetical protein
MSLRVIQSITALSPWKQWNRKLKIRRYGQSSMGTRMRNLLTGKECRDVTKIACVHTSLPRTHTVKAINR